MRAWRSGLIAVLAVALAATLAPAAEAVTPVWVALNASGREAVVTQPGEIPPWFGKVTTMEEPNAGPGYVTGDALCPTQVWAPKTKVQGASLYEISSPKGGAISSNFYQYPSTSAATAAWTRLLAMAANCRPTGTETEEGVTSRYITRVGTLPAMYGRTGMTIFTSSSKGAEGSGGWMYSTYRVLGNAIISSRFSDEVRLSKPRSTVPVEITATAEVLVARSTKRYRSMALQAIG